MANFDLIVIGTGAAASTPASKCRSSGWEVAVIDSRPFGGTCALRGCDPKKVLVRAAELVDWHARAAEKGLLSPSDLVRLDWRRLLRFKSTFTEPVPDSMERRFTEAGIATFHGRARFVDQASIQVGDEVLTARHILIASGAKPRPLDISGEEHLTTSTQFLELEMLPQRIVFVGGGYISFEFAHVAARAGAQVIVLHRSDRPLKGFDPDLVDQLVAATREAGIDVRLNTDVAAIEKTNGRLAVRVATEHGEDTLETDLVVHGAGRVPEIDDLDLEKGGVERSRGVVVNEFLQSVSNPAVYAAGDAAETEGLPLTPVAAHEGHVVAGNLLQGNHRTADYAAVPSVVFTTPPLASVGLQESAAKEKDLRFRVHRQDTTTWFSSRHVAARQSGFKILVDENTDQILGAHLLGPGAEEVINVLATAMRAGMRAADLKKMRFAYPTSSSDISYMLVDRG